jgi:hypothetical protein
VIQVRFNANRARAFWKKASKLRECRTLFPPRCTRSPRRTT